MNVALKTAFESTTDSRGFYSFPALPVGRFDLTIAAAGFQSQKKTNIAIDADSAVTLNTTLEVGQQSEAVTVSASEANVQTQVDTVATHLGEIVDDAQMQAIPLNGRSYTDLLAIQPGVSPVTLRNAAEKALVSLYPTLKPTSVTDAPRRANSALARSMR